MGTCVVTSPTGVSFGVDCPYTSHHHATVCLEAFAAALEPLTPQTRPGVLWDALMGHYEASDTKEAVEVFLGSIFGSHPRGRKSGGRVEESG